MKRLIALSFFIVLTISGFCQQHKTTVREYIKTYTTYPFSDPNPNPLLTPLYPYFRYDGFTAKPIQKGWKVVEIENDFIKLLILPEIGGKIWTAIDKTTNKPFLYDNGVVKFRDVAMRGPWTSGGLEANYGIIGHTPNCATPVDYVIQQKEDGSASCIIGVLEMLTRSYWRMEINLPSDKAYFTTRSFWYNASPIDQPYYHWMNAGLKSAGNLEFIYPGNKFIGHDGEYSDWPITKDGKKISWYDKNDFGTYKSYHVFGKFSEFSGAYWHNDDMGMVRYGSKESKAGTKIWIWGLSQQGMIWEKLLTDNNGQYVELQSGRLFNQNTDKSSQTPFKHISFAPYATDSWTEYWYPVGGTKGIVKATDLGALNVMEEDGWLKIKFSPTQSFTDSLQISDGETFIYNKAVQLKTMELFKDSIRIRTNSHPITVTFKAHHFNYNSDPKTDNLSRPADAPKNFNWNTVYGLYVQGSEAMAMKDFVLAEEKLNATLKLDENYLPALVLLADLYYRNMRYKEAFSLCRKALSIDTHDGGANYYYGLCSEALENIVDAKDGFSLAILSTPYRSAAYTRLSRLSLKENNLEKAIVFATEALVYNANNMDALQIKALCFRLQNNKSRANEILKKILQLDPLNHFAAFENYIATPDFEHENIIHHLIVNELPQQSYLEMAIWYESLGINADALKILNLAPDCPEIQFWKNYLTATTIDFNKINLRLSFPFRSETALILEKLLQRQNHWILKYQLALIYINRNRIKEAEALLNSCDDTITHAPFYVTRAAIHSQDNSDKSLADYQKALSLDSSWRYHKSLAAFYFKQQQSEKALPVLQSFYISHSDNYLMGIDYTKALILNKKYKQADVVLQKLNIIPFEGSIIGREMYRESKLMQALDLIKQQKYVKALSYISATRIWPENLGVGKPYDNDIDYRLEDWLSYYCYKKMGQGSEHKKILNDITAFKPNIETGNLNFRPSNELITAWAYRELNMPEKGVARLNQQIIEFSDHNKPIIWGKAVYENEKVTELVSTDIDANPRILQAFMALENK